MHAVAPPPLAVHPSGIPGAPFRTDPDTTLISDATGRVRIVVTCRTDEDLADAHRIGAAGAVMPDLFASAAKLVAAYEAWMATVEGSADERTALDRWDEVASIETGVIGALLKAAGIPIPEGTAPPAAPTPLSPEDEAAFRPGCTA